MHVHWWWKKKHQQRERKSSITRILMPIMSWYSALCARSRAFVFFLQSNLSHRFVKWYTALFGHFFLLINEPDYNWVVIFSHSHSALIWFRFLFPIHCNRVYNNLQNDLNRSVFFSFSISSLENAAIFPQTCSVHVVSSFCFFFVHSLQTFKSVYIFPSLAHFTFCTSRCAEEKKSDYFRNGLIYACLRH